MENVSLKKQLYFIRKNEYGMQALFIVIGSCIGAIAAMSVMANSESILLLSICSFSAMITNALCIAQAPIKTSWLAFNVSVLINLAIIAFEYLIY